MLYNHLFEILDIVGETLTGLSLAFLSKRLSFLKTSVTSASFKLSGNASLVIVSLKSLCKTLTVTSQLDFGIFGGIFLCVVTFWGFRSLISTSILLNDTSSSLKLFPLVILFLIREIL